MVRFVACAFAFVMTVVPVWADPALARLNERVVTNHVMPLVEEFESAASGLEQAATANCAPDSPELIAAFYKTFDAWTRMSHLRFGPTEAEDRAFAIAFWPDGRGKTHKALGALLTGGDLAVFEPEAFRNASIAARGLYALEFLLYDAQVRQMGTEAARCRLVRAIATDTAQNAGGIARDWAEYGDLLVRPSAQGVYRSDAEATQELYKALLTGLQFTADTRLGRPLGTFERPRPKRAELHRSERSLRQIEMSLQGTRLLAMELAAETPAITARLDALYAAAFGVVAELDDPALAGVADVQGRLRVEILQIAINEIREILAMELGPALGVAAGFNALDGD
ncbi:imelysin family protein [Shimia sediminis]|uniref:imelysin family protein n=1 Tax=Shimia sediminis TaxID=2497945 RepID=UPI0013DEB960|nr:imelysin family protein [Shimia sediminis]